MTRTLTVELYLDIERELVARVEHELKLRSERDVLRLALWHLVNHADVGDVPIEAFALLDSPAAPTRTVAPVEPDALPLFGDEG